MTTFRQKKSCRRFGGDWFFLNRPFSKISEHDEQVPKLIGIMWWVTYYWQKSCSDLIIYDIAALSEAIPLQACTGP